MARKSPLSMPGLTALVLAAALPLSGCAAVLLGAGAGAGGYEAHQAAEMDELEQDYKAGKITKAEYEARKKQIDDSSLFQ